MQVSSGEVAGYSSITMPPDMTGAIHVDPKHGCTDVL